MLNIQVDENEVERRFQEEIKKRISEIEHRTVFWDMKELCRQTCMSESNIKDKFFYDSRFSKHKIGGKWYFPAKATEEFLLQWLSEQ